MNAQRCELCRQRDATVHLAVIETPDKVREQHLCEPCYAKVRAESAGALEQTTKACQPAKVSGGKSRKRAPAKAPSTWCGKCDALVLIRELGKNLNVCPRCQFHFPMVARARIESLADTFKELDRNLAGLDVLRFKSGEAYKSKLSQQRKATGLKDAVVVGIGKIGEHRVGLGVLDFGFMAGSMGSVMGEKLARLIERCTEKALPVVIISTSGGARIYEGTLSLMQMAKTSGALARHSQAKLPYLSVLADPTMGGVLASFAGAGGLILAEPGARIGFAGPRVIKKLAGAELPAGFQTAEFLLERGLIDSIVPRQELKKRLIEYLDFMTPRQKKTAACG